MKLEQAEIIRELGPFESIEQIGGVTFDGKLVWIAVVDRLCAVEPGVGEIVRTFDIPAKSGTAFDGKHLYQLAGGQIQKIDKATGVVISTVPAPSEEDNSGMAWAEGFLWVGQYQGRKIHQVDPETGAILRTIDSNRFVTGVTWVEGELWHGVWEGDDAVIRRIDPKSGEVEHELSLPEGVGVSGLEAHEDHFYAGGGSSKKVRVIRRPRDRTEANAP